MHFDINPDCRFLRRIPTRWVEKLASGGYQVERLAFRPRPGEEPDGISVYLEGQTTAEALATAIEGKEYFVARLSYHQLESLNLTVTPDEDGDRLGLEGHCLIPELNSEFSAFDKNRSKEVQNQLADFVSASIVYDPD